MENLKRFNFLLVENEKNKSEIVEEYFNKFHVSVFTVVGIASLLDA